MIIMRRVHEAMRPIIVKTRSLLVDGETDITAFWVSTGAIFWGLWLLTFGSFEGTVTYSMLSTLASERVWGSAIFSVGVLKYLALMFNVDLRFRVILDFLMFTLWTLVAISFMVGYWRGTATIVYTFFSLASLWIMTRRLAQLRSG